MSDPTSSTIVIHDYFAVRGGGERLVLTLAEALGAALMHGYRESETYEPEMFPVGAIDLRLPMMLRNSGVRTAALSLRFAAMRRKTANYRTRIFSGTSAPFAAPSKGVGGRNIYYCHTPPRFLYDQREHFAHLTAGPAAPLKKLALARYQAGYLAAVDRMDVILANSKNIQARIARYLGRDSLVVYPPCDTGRFSYRGQGDYYLSTARVSGLKRVGAIVEAFLGMPDRRLVVASGGDELSALRARARGVDNISFLGWVDDVTLQRLMGEAIATLYGPVDEDFGISPVESMAAGKPVIGVAEGGLKETIIDGETGFLLPPGYRPDDIAAAVRELTPQRAAAMREACERRAEDFSVARFVDAMRDVVGGR